MVSCQRVGETSLSGSAEPRGLGQGALCSSRPALRAPPESGTESLRSHSRTSHSAPRTERSSDGHIFMGLERTVCYKTEVSSGRSQADQISGHCSGIYLTRKAIMKLKKK